MKNLLSYFQKGVTNILPNLPLLSYMNSMIDPIRLILLNQEYLKNKAGCRGWINLTGELKCYHHYLSKKSIGSFDFSYKGNIILKVTMWHATYMDAEHINEDTKKIVSVRGELSSKLGYDDYATDMFSFKFNPETNKSTIKFNDTNFDKDLMIPVIQKCLNLLYKKAVVKNSKRLQEEHNKIAEIEKQKQIKKAILREKISDFANDYKITDVIG